MKSISTNRTSANTSHHIRSKPCASPLRHICTLSPREWKSVAQAHTQNHIHSIHIHMQHSISTSTVPPRHSKQTYRDTQKYSRVCADTPRDTSGNHIMCIVIHYGSGVAVYLRRWWHVRMNVYDPTPPLSPSRTRGGMRSACVGGIVDGSTRAHMRLQCHRMGTFVLCVLRQP